jgi:hypothetical protein
MDPVWQFWALVKISDLSLNFKRKTPARIFMFAIIRINFFPAAVLSG